MTDGESLANNDKVREFLQCLKLPIEWERRDGDDIERLLDRIYHNYNEKLEELRDCTQFVGKFLYQYREYIHFLQVGIKQCVREYINGSPAGAYRTLSTILENENQSAFKDDKPIKWFTDNVHLKGDIRVKGDDTIEYETITPQFYRMRKENARGKIQRLKERIERIEQSPYDPEEIQQYGIKQLDDKKRERVSSDMEELREQFYHNPFRNRRKVFTQRFSIPGNPFLYLGGSPEICYREIREKEKKYYYAKFSMRKEQEKNCHLLYLTQNCQTLTKWWDVVKQKKQFTEVEKLDAEREKHFAEMEKLAAEKEKLAAEKEKLDAEKEKLAAEKEKLAAEKEKLAAEMEKLAAEMEKHNAEVEKLAAEKEKLLTEGEKYNAEVEKHNAEVEKHNAEKEKLAAEWEKLDAEEKKNRTSIETVCYIINASVMWILTAACLIKVKKNENEESEAPFKPEYIVPQLLLQWLCNKNTRPINSSMEQPIFGICYLSTDAEEYKPSEYNYVFPAFQRFILDYEYDRELVDEKEGKSLFYIDDDAIHSYTPPEDEIPTQAPASVE